jgi:hypothetical protein
MAAVNVPPNTFTVSNVHLTIVYSMFNQQEVQILLGGVNSPVDLDDLRKHTSYGGVYDDDELTITAFWNVGDLY